MISEIPRPEYAERARKVQKELVARNLDGLLAFSTECEPANVRYLSGCFRHELLVETT